MEKFRTPIILVLIAALLAGGIVFFIRQNTSSCPVEITLPDTSSVIEVYVSGEVKTPGLYVLSEAAQTIDAIEAAGGFTQNADQSTVNLARTLRNNAHIHVLKKGESSQRININTADVWLLDALPGIGESTAQRIVDYRVENGLFECVEDLLKVKGVGDSTFLKLEDKITVH